MKPTKKIPTTPRLVTKAQFADMRGMDRGLLSRRIKAGVVQVEGEKELINIEKADAALAAALGPKRRRGSTAARPGSGRRSPTPRDDGPTLYEARRRRAVEEAERARIGREREEIELAVLRGKLAPIEQFTEVWSEGLQLLRSKLLNIPCKISHECAAESDHKACFRIIQAAIYGALDEIVNAATDKAAADEGPAIADKTAETNTEAPAADHDSDDDGDGK